ncbi:MAG: SPOR domain-containing protein [Candidatus Omnitrophota bacterium]|jgi:tetratricopeptide (TPR) repeat protein
MRRFKEGNFRKNEHRLGKVKVLFFTSSFLLFTFSLAFALNLEKLKIDLLNGDYKTALKEGEKILAAAGHAPDIDQLYYLLGICYLKDGNYLRSSDIFEIILKEFKKSPMKEEAALGLGDAYFFQNNFQKADACYQEMLSGKPQTKYKAMLYSRLSQTAYKRGDVEKGKLFSDKLKQEFPLNLESSAQSDICALADFSNGSFYTVQVGCFSSLTNANNLRNKLSKSGYDAFSEVSSVKGKQLYRVRVGKFSKRDDAAALENKLSQEGYPTKISP